MKSKFIEVTIPSGSYAPNDTKVSINIDKILTIFDDSTTKGSRIVLENTITNDRNYLQIKENRMEVIELISGLS